MRSIRTALLATACAAAAGAAIAKPAITTTYQHVLLISVDGMHAVDLTNWIANNPNSNFAQLKKTGVIYPNAFTTGPSDSYPGMLAQVSGATPKTAGLFYDDSYDRNEYPSVNYYVSQNQPDPGCTTPPGAEVTNFEELDKSYNFQTGLVSDITAGGTLGQVYTQLDPNNMQRRIVNGKCVPVYPHEYVRTNTIFEVIKQAGLYTAWSDKHPAYEDLSGPSGRGLDEIYAPEINSQDTLDPCAQPGDDYTKSYTGVRTYDSLKVQAVINWIDGFNSTRTKKLAGAPAIFGMNFQAVSVGQKLAKSGNADCKTPNLKGGYLDANATPGRALAQQFQFVDSAIGAMRQELKNQGLDKSTLIIVSAKHGQSPIDVKLRKAISDSGFQATPGYGSNGFEICDDAALIWLSPQQQQQPGVYKQAEQYLTQNAASLNIAYLMDRNSLRLAYGDPFHNSRVPDFIAVTNHGDICTGGSKLAEHGGFSNDDRNVALIVSGPGVAPQYVQAPVTTTQIAPTILQALGLDPNALKAVHTEGTQVLPGN